MNNITAPIIENTDEPAAKQRIMDVGFIGLGHMGAGMAANLLKAGHRVSVFNRTPARTEALVTQGANAALSIAAACQGDAEALTLVGKEGIDQRKYLEFLTSTLFTAPVYKIYGDLIISGRFAPAAFAAPLGQKDVRLVLAAAENLRVPMPIGSLLRDRFLTLMAHDGEQLDWSTIGRLAAVDAGMAAA